MIIRTLPLRHGRIALARPPIPLRTWRRTVATETPAERTTDTPTVKNPFEGEQLPTRRVQSPPINASGERFEIRDPDHPVARELQLKHHLKTTTQHVGGTVDSDHYRPHMLLSNPPWPKDITLELLMASQAHIGHSTALWHPANAKYIFGIRGTADPIHVISLDVTAAYLRRACRIVQGVAEKGGLILFVGTRAGQARAVVRAAGLAKGCHLFTKWIPGAITNGQQILGRCQKKVVDEHDNEVPGFEEQLYDQAVVKPDLVVCLNPVENYILLHECGLNNIPTIGVVDTNCNPTWVTYPIPANDDSLRCIHVIAGVLGRAGQIGQMNRMDSAKRGQVQYRSRHSLEKPSTKRAAEVSEQSAQDDLEKEFAELDELEYGNVADSTLSAEALAESTAPEEEALDEVDPSLVNEEFGSTQEDAFQPYERDRPLEGESAEETEILSESADDFEYPPETAEEAELRERLQEAARQQEEDRRP